MSIKIKTPPSLPLIKGRKRAGKIIVIDGVDGSGKKTQTKLLVARLKKLKKRVVTFDFPQYEKNFFGRNIKEFLTDPEYQFHKQHPKVFSMILAADRWETKEKIEKYLKKGYLVILDRYMSSNQIHQGGKIKDDKKWSEFMDWLDILEFKVFKIPRPDIILYLNLNIVTVKKLLEQREKNDNADKDIEHQKESQVSALKLAKKYKNFKVIDCDNEKGGIKSREDISDLIFEKVRKYL